MVKSEKKETSLEPRSHKGGRRTQPDRLSHEEYTTNRSAIREMYFATSTMKDAMHDLFLLPEPLNPVTSRKATHGHPRASTFERELERIPSMFNS
ncbi:hypothetical protein Moror_9482 [Moniliophthora roreri MCA 2997]|uniref:Uncharacterized protein n=1 Tax=Moniliophthora roreri (strain MCA 2997) TaxID=1381753 RepID=V2WWI1_MONRO|nr:hypothetical protein Moror_9482 [Moniliophthora roreri MCA 2997]